MKIFLDFFLIGCIHNIMLRIRGRGFVVWIALFCSLLLPLTAMSEMCSHRVEAISCGMPDSNCNCCPMDAGQVSGCHGCSGSMPYLSPCGTIIHDWQAIPHRLEQTTPVFKAFTADIFHPPKFGPTLV